MVSDKNRPLSSKLLVTQAQKGDRQALSKLLTLAENDLKKAISLVSGVEPKGVRIGVTGPPGAGKSTLLGRLIGHYRKQKKKVAVLAVDPSSPFSGGAVLGDRIRMSDHYNDKGVFIRSVGSRGGFGGLSAATGTMVRLLEMAKFDVVIIETVGVGQTELEIMNLAHVTAVVLVPESGDVIQTMKAGILEIADAFIVNKSDRPQADVLATELKNMVHQEAKSPKEVFQTVALDGKGVNTVADSLLKLARKNKKSHSRSMRQKKGELRALVLADIDSQLKTRFEKSQFKDPYRAYKNLKIPRL